MPQVEEQILIKEEIRVYFEDMTFFNFCVKQANDLMTKESKETLDYLQFYIYLHFVLEISVSSLFRAFLIMHVFLKISNFENIVKSVSDIDKLRFCEKINLLINFPTIISAQDINKLCGDYNNFAEKRNAILHGYSLGKMQIVGGSGKEEKILNWFNEATISSQVILYNNIVTTLSKFIDVLPHLTPSGKESLKKEYCIIF